MRKTMIAGLFLLLAGLWPALGAAQLSGTAVPASGAALSVELNEGQLIRLDRPAASVFIANPDIADLNVRSTRLVYIFGKRPGRTTLFALDKNDQVVVNTQIVVNHNISRLKDSLDALVPTSDVNVNSIDGAIVLSGAVPTATDAENIRRIAGRFVGEGEEIINQLSVTSPNQVNLRVRIAEVSRDILNRFGFNWDTLFSGENFLLGFATANPLLESASFLEGTYTRGSFDANAIIDALADDGLITILAEPNLTALSGETASFLAGGEFPIPISQDNDSITVEFKQFGVSLSFTPTILDSNRINLHVRPESSQLTSAGAVTLQNISIPGLTTRRAETTIELGSGQSFAIAGLLLDDSQELVKKTPGLGDLPVLGALFKSERFKRKETELVIIVTPYIVHPVSDQELALPTDPYTKPAPPARPEREAEVSQTIPVPTAQTRAVEQTGSAGYILD